MIAVGKIYIVMTLIKYYASAVMKRVFLLLALAVCFVCSYSAYAQKQPPYKNAKLSIEQRVKDLLGRMTPEEKFRQLFMVPGDLGEHPEQFKSGLFGFQVNTATVNDNAAGQMMTYSPGRDTRQTIEKVNSIQRYFVEQSRLGIPVIIFDEALHGLVRTGATSFPQSIALAATWDTALMGRVANAIAYECKQRGIRQILSPVVNLATDVRWGRVEETYGEDPVLSAAMGVAYVRAFEQMGIITTPKHFVVNHGAGGRDSYPVEATERELEESYFVPFKACIKEGGARSIMTAYNSLNGSPCTANNWLLNNKLKQDWDFKGFVISDAGAVGGANVLHFTALGYEDAGKQAIENGLDVIFQTDIAHADLFKAPFINGKVNRAKLDSAVARVLRAKFELGLFEHPYVPQVSLDDTAYLRVHHQLAKEAALKSIVLLKNDEKSVLPLAAGAKRIAVIGPDAIEARLGGYSGPGNDNVNLLDALKKAVGSGKTVQFASGCSREHKLYNVVAPEFLSSKVGGKRIAGLEGEYYNNTSLEGEPVVTRTDAKINFQWTLFSPDPKINYDFYSCRWTGYITAPKAGKIKIGIEGNEGYRLYINDRLILDTWTKQAYGTSVAEYYFEESKEYKIRVEYKEPAGNSRFKLVWNADVVDTTKGRIAEAVQLAEESDIVVVTVGTNEGEFQDRSHLNLPGRQEEMIQRLAATGKPIVVVLFGGSAVTMSSWIGKVNAVVDVWYPGEAGGDAIADILLGKVSPSGKLPITFPMNEGQLPLTYNHKPTGRGDDYADGTGQPLFPFGYGLSYTNFEYKLLSVSNPKIKVNDSVILNFVVSNTGGYEGDEVVQLYIRDELASVVRPLKELKAFKRVHLEPRGQKALSFTITPAMLQMLNAKMQRVVEPGTFRIMIGSSSKDIRLVERIEVMKG